MSIQTECVDIELELSRLTPTKLAELRAAIQNLNGCVRIILGTFDEATKERLMAHLMAIGASAQGLIGLGRDPQVAILAAVSGCQRLDAVIGDVLRAFPIGG